MKTKRELRRFLGNGGIRYTETESGNALYSLSFFEYPVQMAATLDCNEALIVGRLPFTSNGNADDAVASLRAACDPDLYGSEFFTDSAGSIFVKASVRVVPGIKPDAALFKRCFDTIYVAVMMALPELCQLVERELLLND